MSALNILPEVDYDTAEAHADPVQMLRDYFVAPATETREWLHTPHIAGGHVCASDGHWFAVLDTRATQIDDLPRADLKYNPRDYIEAIHAYDGGFLSASSIGIAILECVHCHGTGFARQSTCDHCHGKGEFDRGGYTYDCKNCDGTGTEIIVGGTERCKECCGQPSRAAHAPSTHADAAAGLSASSFYIDRLRAIRGEISTHVVYINASTPAWIIRFPGGCGALSPMQGGQPLRPQDSDLAQPATEGLGGAA